MEEAQDLSSDMQDKDNLAGEVMNSLGEPNEASSEVDESHESQGGQTSNDPLFVQKRLKQQQRKHARELQAMQERMNQMQQSMMQLPVNNANNYSMPNQTPNYTGQPNMQMQNGMPSMDNQQLQAAVSAALQQREAMEAQTRVQRQYQELQNHLDKMSDKHEDFDDVVRSENAPFTKTMRDLALTLPKTGPGSAGEVLYKLGKNPEELEKISKLHPVEQGAEMIRMSHALISGANANRKTSNDFMAPLGNVKNTPVSNSVGINEKTPVSSIRERMKQGAFK